MKQYAEERGLKPTEAVRELISTALYYKLYKDIDGATIMKVIDILDRLYKMMVGWLQQTNINMMLENFETLTQLADALAPSLGYIKPTEIKQEVKEKVKKRTLLDDLIEKAVDRIADRVVDYLTSTKEGQKLLQTIAGSTKVGMIKAVMEEEVKKSGK